MTNDEPLARFLRLNYRAGTTAVAWEDADPDEREMWLAESAIILDEFAAPRPTLRKVWEYWRDNSDLHHVLVANGPLWWLCSACRSMRS